METLLTSHDDALDALDVLDVLDVLALRGPFSPAGHLAWTGIAAAALYAAARSGWTPRRTAGAVAAFAVAVGLHTAWDATRLMPVMAVVAVVSLATLTWTAHHTARSTVMITQTRPRPRRVQRIGHPTSRSSHVPAEPDT